MSSSVLMVSTSSLVKRTPSWFTKTQVGLVVTQAFRIDW